MLAEGYDGREEKQAQEPFVLQGVHGVKFFLAGIMQGSHVGSILHNQEYRQRLLELLARHLPGADIYDPLADHTNSLNYDDELGRRVFFRHNELCAQVDVVLAFVPEASMGTAIEMWQAYRHGKIVVAISPLIHNWTIKFLSHIIYRDEIEFEEALLSGNFASQLKELRDRL